MPKHNHEHEHAHGHSYGDCLCCGTEHAAASQRNSAAAAGCCPAGESACAEPEGGGDGEDPDPHSDSRCCPGSDTQGGSSRGGCADGRCGSWDAPGGCCGDREPSSHSSGQEGSARAHGPRRGSGDSCCSSGEPLGGDCCCDRAGHSRDDDCDCCGDADYFNESSGDEDSGGNFRARAIGLGVAAALIAAGVAFSGSLSPFLFAAGILACGHDALWRGAKALARLRFNEFSLLLVAIVAAFFLRESLEAAMVVLLFVIGQAVEDRAARKAELNVKQLMSIRPDTAYVERGGEIIPVPAASLPIGSEIVIRMGDVVPIDCKVTQGSSLFDLSPLTGESEPVSALPGDAVPSGAINTQAVVRAVTSERFESSAASKIIALLQQGGKKAAAQRFISRFAAVYTPIVMAVAAGVAFLPPLFGGELAVWGYRALVLLVASCPCAVVISVPLTFVAGIGGCARAGIILKGGQVIEQFYLTRAVAFDKTGTLTEKIPTVVEVLAFGAYTAQQITAYAAAVERYSSHPVAAAIAAHDGGEALAVDRAEEIPGAGMGGVVMGREILCASRRYLEAQGLLREGLPEAGVYVVIDGAVEGAFVLRDTLKPGAKEAVAALRRAGVEHIALLSGDAAPAVRAVAEAVGADSWQAALSPSAKADAIAALRASGPVAFVGDGINDAPVLLAADTGISMGLGADAAKEVADAVLAGENLASLPRALALARRTMRIVKQNIAFALAVKTVVMLLGIAGFAPMWLAVLADVGVSIVAILNATRVLR